MIETRRAYKYRIWPTKGQITQFEDWLEKCRFIYNAAIRERTNEYKKLKKSMTYVDQTKQLPGFKALRPDFKVVHSLAYLDTLKRVDKAFAAFFRRCKSGEKPGYPKYCPYGQYTSFSIFQMYREKRFLPAYYKGKIYVPKIGNVKAVIHRPLPKNKNKVIKSLTISKEGSKWFACISMETKVKVRIADTDKIGAFDLGVGENFITLDDGTQINYPRYYRQSQKKLAKINLRLSKLPKKSTKRAKLKRALQCAHCKIRNQRKDFHHKTALMLVKKLDIIIHEDLNIRYMTLRPKKKEDPDHPGHFLPNKAKAKGGLNKSILDAGWGSFLLALADKATKYNRKVIAVKPDYTSQECSECGYIVKKSLSTRTHQCPKCGYIDDRDINAAKVILSRGLATLAN